MFISELFASGFRCFGNDRPLSLKLKPGLNLLVGPNDAGKTAIIDIPRFVLTTRGDEFVRLEINDFHVDQKGERASELLIRCTFDGLSPDEESRFLEWCSNEIGTLRLHVTLRANLRKKAGGGYMVVSQCRAGKVGDGPSVDGELREYIKATYLRPLRDVERELRSGRRSRLSRILGTLPLMANEEKEAPEGAPATLKDILCRADIDIDNNEAVKTVQTLVNETYLSDLSFSGDPLSATLGLGLKGSFDQLLERLELSLDPSPGQTQRVMRGLGYNNLLFMAAELLLLQSDSDQVPFLLIEEPEAHLHPQHQTLFMQVLTARCQPVAEDAASQQVQVLLSTHSPQLAASAELESVSMVISQTVYPLTKGQTRLQNDDYAFLRRFLDATKANLFFARGVVIVEGDAENILLPAIAKKIGKSFAKYGVSIVNVGHRGLFRYSRILQRQDGSEMHIPVSLIPDRDIPPDAAKELIKHRPSEGEWDAEEKAAYVTNLYKDEGGAVRAFPSEQWTLEFDLARKPGLAALIYQAVLIAKGAAGKNAEQLAERAREEIEALQADQSKTAEDVAVHIFTPLYKKHVSKAEAAEQLAALIEKSSDTAEEFRAKLPAYLIAAIEHVTSGQAPAVQEAKEPQPDAPAVQLAAAAAAR